MLRWRYFTTAIFIGVILGFPIVAAISAQLGIRSTPLSIGVRATIVVISLLALLHARPPQVNLGSVAGILLLSSLFFWVFYLLRILSYTLLYADQLLHPPMHYWMWTVGSSFLPFLAVALARTVPEGLTLARIVLFGALATTLLIIPNASTQMISGSRIVDVGRLQLDSLNPISLGRLGVVLLVLTMWSFLYDPIFRRSMFLKCVGLSAFVLALYLLILSGSRGPVVALASAIVFLGCSLSLRRTIQFSGVVALLGAAIFVLATLLDSSQFETTIDRYLSAMEIRDAASIARIQSYSGAWSVFKEHPVLGFGMEEPTTGFYPHNVVLEAFMATGIIGGVLLVCTLCLALYLSFRLLRTGHGWVALLFGVFLAQSMFSGSLYQAGELWVLIAMVMLVSRRGGLLHPAARQPNEARSPAERVLGRSVAGIR
jgi:O-antigen ligase